MSVYLDYNATTPIDERVLDYMIENYRSVIGNADSRTHGFGEKARATVENSRKQVAELLSVVPEEVFFTSGATESINIAIQGLREYAERTGRNHIVTTAIEHKAVLETVKYLSTLGYEVDIISPDETGRGQACEVLNRVKDNTLLVSVMHVNNETGIIQPVDEIGKRLKNSEVLFHVDATQSCGKLVEEIQALDYNMLSFSAHKLTGPQGVGALVLRRRAYRLPPVKAIMYGGQQECGLRPGTIPVALVAGCGKACEIAKKEYKQNWNHANIIKAKLREILNRSGLEYEFNGDPAYCVSNTFNISLRGIASEALMISTKQYCGISNGSACTSKNYSPSYVLEAMGFPRERIESSIRVSWGPQTVLDEAAENFSRLLEIAKQMKN